ncbi:MAG: heavy-metal-associated domain-containing protein [Chloroflexota bacterium]
MNKTVTFNTPALYGDHHVLEVRSILLTVPGVQDVYASSAFRVVDVTYDDAVVAEADIARRLEQSGYLGEWLLPEEQGIAAHLQTDKALSFFRHTEVFETSRQVVSFAQNVNTSGRPLWNCPGFGVIKNKMED